MSREQKPYGERTTADQRRAYRQARMRRAFRLHRLLLRTLCNGPPRCKLCGVTERHHQLDVDHEQGKRYRADRLRYDARVDRYWAEYREGAKLRVLCRRCNGRDGGERRAEGRVYAGQN